VGDTVKTAAANRLVGQYAKPDFYHVHPGGSSRSEVK
jgi:hypothetical protein